MRERVPPSQGLAGRVALIAFAAALMVLGVLGAGDAWSRRAAAAEPAQPVRIVAAELPIAAEADVYRTTPTDAGAELPRRAAHARTLSTYRGLRAYPGAPPRIPHGLTNDELRTTACRSCHERGGYAQRFGAYAPVTPHPEQTECLQCHAGDDALYGDAPPADAPNALCRQCHDTRSLIRQSVLIDWRPAAWPSLAPRPGDGTPPPIPHELALRGNCNACHAGAAAVAELRTTHPERTDCRQCHVSTSDIQPFTRPVTGGER